MALAMPFDNGFGFYRDYGVYGIEVRGKINEYFSLIRVCLLDIPYI